MKKLLVFIASYLPGNADTDPLLRHARVVTDEKEYLTDAFAREAVDSIDRSRTQPARWIRPDARNAEPGGGRRAAPSPARKGKGKANSAIASP